MHLITIDQKFRKGKKPYQLLSTAHACHNLDQVIAYFGRPDRFMIRSLLGPNRMNTDLTLPVPVSAILLLPPRLSDLPSKLM